MGAKFACDALFSSEFSSNFCESNVIRGWGVTYIVYTTYLFNVTPMLFNFFKPAPADPGPVS